MNNSPYTTAGGTAAAASVILTYLIGLINAHLVVERLGWEAVPAEVTAALVGLIIGYLINMTHGAPQPAAGTAELVRSSEPTKVADPPPGATKE